MKTITPAQVTLIWNQTLLRMDKENEVESGLEKEPKVSDMGILFRKLFWLAKQNMYILNLNWIFFYICIREISNLHKLEQLNANWN